MISNTHYLIIGDILAQNLPLQYYFKMTSYFLKYM